MRKTCFYKQIDQKLWRNLWAEASLKRKVDALRWVMTPEKKPLKI